MALQLDPDLRGLHDALQDSLQGVTPDELTKRPAEGKWSAVEVLEHLTLSYTGTTRGLNRCLEAGHPLAGKPSLRDRFFRFIVTGVGFVPGGRTAPAVTTPKGKLTVENAVEQIFSGLSEMDSKLAECADRFGKKVLILDHPVLGPLNLRQWAKFHRVHGLHHIKQVQRIRALARQSKG